MARRRKLSEGKKNIIAELIEEYDIKTANDIQEALKDRKRKIIPCIINAGAVLPRHSCQIWNFSIILSDHGRFSS